MAMLGTPAVYACCLGIDMGPATNGWIPKSGARNRVLQGGRQRTSEPSLLTCPASVLSLDCCLWGLIQIKIVTGRGSAINRYINNYAYTYTCIGIYNSMYISIYIYISLSLY